MNNEQLTINWVLEQVKSNKPIISDAIVPTLKEKGMKRIQQKLAKRGIQVWWNQQEAGNTSIILPRGLNVVINKQDGWKVGMVMQDAQVIMLPPMKA